ncbi:MAG: multiprotein-bridging factor 1 family protein [Halobacteriales archaeon]|nr:multiprotein-bridging factor 1 family protein [Halobacteriales archaeon]
MPKYSTGSSSGGGGDTCELCGRAADRLDRATISGAELLVCPDCAPHDDTDRATSDEEQNEERKRRKQAAQNTARATDAMAGDSSHWEQEGTDYENDPLPYLRRGYGDIVEEARQEAGYQRQELAETLGVSENDLLAVEQGRAVQAKVGGSLITQLESELNIELTEE